MRKTRTTAQIASSDMLESIKKTAIVAMFSDDELMDTLVLKGGNAVDIVHQANVRASVDLDFSMPDDLEFAKVQPQIERALRKTFELEGYLAFDIKMSPRPHSIDAPKRRTGVDRRQLQMGTWDGKIYRWIGEFNVDVVHEAAVQLLFRNKRSRTGTYRSAAGSPVD